MPPHVKSEVVRPGEGLVAEVALEGFVPGVLPEVRDLQALLFLVGLDHKPPIFRS